MLRSPRLFPSTSVWRMNRVRTERWSIAPASVTWVSRRHLWPEFVDARCRIGCDRTWPGGRYGKSGYSFRFGGQIFLLDGAYGGIPGPSLRWTEQRLGFLVAIEMEMALILVQERCLVRCRKSVDRGLCFTTIYPTYRDLDTYLDHS